MHPDEQVHVLEIERAGDQPPPNEPELEWVLPTFLAQKWSLRALAEVFDSINTVPQRPTTELEAGHHPCTPWRGHNRMKRLLLAVVDDDSTVAYYVVHDGIVKPRQN
jgi:tRNA-splicing endonuclease subunit Sen15, fungi type